MDNCGTGATPPLSLFNLISFFAELTLPTYNISGGVTMYGVIVFMSIFCGIFGAVEILRVIYCTIIKYIGRKGIYRQERG